MKRMSLACAALLLAGCGKDAPPDPIAIRCPSARLMTSPASIPDLPPGAAGNRATETYIAESRARHGAARRQVKGLQGWAKNVCGGAS
jgi:hypothetical protein